MPIIISISSSNTVAAAVDYLSGCNMITCLFLNWCKKPYILTIELNQMGWILKFCKGKRQLSYMIMKRTSWSRVLLETPNILTVLHFRKIYWAVSAFVCVSTSILACNGACIFCFIIVFKLCPRIYIKSLDQKLIYAIQFLFLLIYT
jgi:hypothetical protein